MAGGGCVSKLLTTSVHPTDPMAGLALFSKTPEQNSPICSQQRPAGPDTGQPALDSNHWGEKAHSAEWERLVELLTPIGGRYNEPHLASQVCLSGGII